MIVKRTLAYIESDKLLRKSPLYTLISDLLRSPASSELLLTTSQTINSNNHLDQSDMADCIHSLELMVSRLTRIAGNHLLHHLIRLVLKYHHASVTPSEDANLLNLDDKRGIYYVGGFIIHSLIEHYRKYNQADVVEGLANLLTDEPTADYADWTVLQNRGGLSYIGDETFKLFISMECAIQPKLACLTNCPLLATLMNVLLRDEHIIQLWIDLYGEESESIFYKLVRKFCNVRCKQIAENLF